MKISLKWLRSLVNLPVSDDEIIERLTLLGLEVDGVENYESVPGGLRGVIVGEVLETTAHPQADRLKVCTVSVEKGTEPLQIVCGASNVAQGQKVPVAMIGTTLFPTSSDHSTGSEPLVIKKSKIRGVESFGMICAEDELGLGHGHEGILVLNSNVQIGANVADILGIYSDKIIEIGLTPNRTDAMAHYGVARDLVAYFGEFYTNLFLKLPSVSDLALKDSTLNSVSVHIDDEARCPIYYGLEINNIRIKESPEWLKNYLKAIGQRTINNIVDVTNYVLFELGQPLHAFDVMQIAKNKEGKSQIIVRTAFPGEDFIALDEKKYNLNENDLVIADTEKPLCFAGIMGGINSGVTSTTTHIFLESAYFHPDTIRKSSSGNAIHTETAYRFARGTDPTIVSYALQRAADLILLTLDDNDPKPLIGKITHFSENSVQQLQILTPKKINYDTVRAEKIMGVSIPEDLSERILDRLDFKIISREGTTLMLEAPIYRTDVSRFQDVAEEVLRVFGLNNVPLPDHFSGFSMDSETDEEYALEQKILNQLSAKGLSEIRTNSLIGTQYIQKAESFATVDMLNPLSRDAATLRPTLLFSGLEVISHNINRKQTDLHLFELGKVYYKKHSSIEPLENNLSTEYIESSALGIFLTGNRTPIDRQFKPSPVDFFDLKAIVLRLLEDLNIDYRIEYLSEDNQNENQVPFNLEQWSFGLDIYSRKKKIAQLGRIKNNHIKKFDIKADVWFAQINWDLCLQFAQPNQISYKEIPKFPAVKRDISMLVSDGISFAEIEKLIKECAPKLVQEIELFDVYIPQTSPNLESSIHKSYALSVILLDPNQTLTDSLVRKTMDKIFTKLEQTGKITIRK